MKHKFVMDENTVVSAYNLEDDQGKQDFTCAQLWLNIAQNCHRIALNDYLLEKYRKKTTHAQNPGLKIVRIIQYLMTNSNKNEFLAYSPAYDWTSNLPSDDASIVLLAIQSGSVLVTSDLRLKAKLASLSYPQVKSLKVLSPKDAVPLTLAT